MSDPESPSTYRAPDITLYGAEHIARYRDTDGEVGWEWNGAHCLILTTTGRKSGQARDNALIYGVYGDSVAVVASAGGAPTHPAWYLNIEADPHVTVQIKGEVFPAVARTVEGEERGTVWKIMTTDWPNYDEYTKRTDRVIPVVVLDRVAS